MKIIFQLEIRISDNCKETEEGKKIFLQLTESSIGNLTEENWKILRKYGLDSKEKILKLAKETYEDQHSCNLMRFSTWFYLS
ncbi:MAG: hypothetical protein QXJ58_06300 [Archaeoglobaceae archaeon]